MLILLRNLRAFCTANRKFVDQSRGQTVHLYSTERSVKMAKNKKKRNREKESTEIQNRKQKQREKGSKRMTTFKDMNGVGYLSEENQKRGYLLTQSKTFRHLQNQNKICIPINLTYGYLYTQNESSGLGGALRGPTRTQRPAPLGEISAQRPEPRAPRARADRASPGPARLGAKQDFEVWTYDSDNSTRIKLGLAFYAR